MGYPTRMFLMNQRDGFASGFLFGSIVGGMVGGLIGALVASQQKSESASDVDPQQNASLSEPKNSKGKRSQIKPSSSEATKIEAARRSLEDKIAQLNETIDEVRLTLGNVNGNLPEETTQLTKEP